MKSRCKGLLGLIFGHKWVETIEVIHPVIIHGPDFVHTSGGVRCKKYMKCKRCGNIYEVKK